MFGTTRVPLLRCKLAATANTSERGVVVGRWNVGVVLLECEPEFGPEEEFELTLVPSTFSAHRAEGSAPWARRQQRASGEAIRSLQNGVKSPK